MRVRQRTKQATWPLNPGIDFALNEEQCRRWRMLPLYFMPGQMGRIKNQRHQQLHTPRKHKFFRARHVKPYDYHLVWELLLFGASAFREAGGSASRDPFALPAQAQEGRKAKL